MVLDAQDLEVLMDKILIIQTAFPGDAILTLPLLEYIHSSNKNALIDVIAIPATKDIFESSPFVNKVIVLDKRKKHKSILSILKFSSELKKANYTKLISPHRSFRTSLIVFLCGIKDSVGFDTASFCFVYNKRVKYDSSAHEVKRLLNLVSDEIADWKLLPKTQLVKSENSELERLIKMADAGKIVVIAPGSVWATKKYPEEYFIEIARSLVSKNYKIFFTGGKDEKEMCGDLAAIIGENAFNTAGLFTIPESIELFKHCELVISNDSAPTHMALAANAKVLTIYCSTVPEFGFYPYSEKSRFISEDTLPCKPCGIHGHKTCPEKHFNCGKELFPSKIYPVISELLED